MEVSVFLSFLSGVRGVYPASGYRTGQSGTQYGVGEYGYAWSSSANSATYVYGSGIGFNSNAVTPELYDYRSLGFPVRCVQFRNRRAQRPLAGYAEPPRNSAPVGGVKSN